MPLLKSSVWLVYHDVASYIIVFAMHLILIFDFLIVAGNNNQLKMLIELYFHSYQRHTPYYSLYKQTLFTYKISSFCATKNFNNEKFANYGNNHINHVTHYEKRDHSEYRQQYESKSTFIMTMANLLSTNVSVSIDTCISVQAPIQSGLQVQYITPYTQ